MRREITLVDNQYIKIVNIYKNGSVYDPGDLVTTVKKPTKPISEWTPDYEKHVAYWVGYADKVNAKQKTNA